MTLKILFVDDDQNILDSFKAMMHGMRKEWKSFFATDAHAALELVNKEKFDIVIADMRMPLMDGAELLKEVAKIQPDTVRIILSGYSEIKALLKSAKHAHQFLSKPCSSEVLIDTIRRLMEIRHVLSNSAVRSIVTQLDTLPALPDLYFQITRELEKTTPDLKKIGELAKQDIGISATLMKVVNSSFFGFYETVSSPAHAAVLLGTDVLKGLILSVNFLQELDAKILGSYSVGQLWEHSLQTGYLAKAVSTNMGEDKKTRNNCFVAGLLHDIGKLIFITEMSSQYGKVLQVVREEGGPIVDVEKRLLGVTHAEVGAYLLGLWGFNETIVKSIYCHHSLAHCGDEFGPAHAVHVADVLQHELAPRESDYEFTDINSVKLKSAGLMQHVDEWREACLKAMDT